MGGGRSGNEDMVVRRSRRVFFIKFCPSHQLHDGARLNKFRGRFQI
jgi:hypothetical protein